MQRILSQTINSEQINFFEEFIRLCVFQSEEGGMWLENLLYQNLNAYEKSQSLPCSMPTIGHKIG